MPMPSLLQHGAATVLLCTVTIMCPIPAPGVSEARQLVPAPRPGGGSHRLLAGGPLGEVQVQASSITHYCWRLTWRAEDLERRPSSTKDWREARRSVDSDLEYDFLACDASVVAVTDLEEAVGGQCELVLGQCGGKRKGRECVGQCRKAVGHKGVAQCSLHEAEA